jgi:hypothetical protein
LTVDERRATTWLELQELLFADAWNDRLGLFRSSYAYRGCSDARADLSSGLVRIGGDPELYLHDTFAQGFTVLELEPEGARGNPTQDLVLLRKTG